MPRLVLIALLLLAALAPAAEAKRVRVFAVSPKFDLSWVETRQDFRGKLLALVDRRARGAGAPVVQAGADDVVRHLLGPANRRRPVRTARDLVAFPEDLGLMAAFSGARGATARQAGDLVSAVLGLIGAYGPVNAYYAQRFPALASRGIPTRLLAVSLTDTFVRVAVEPTAELADRLDAYVVLGVNMARDWRVVCTDDAAFEPLPGGVGCDVEDPERVAALRAPDEPQRDYAYEATTAKAVNMALVIDPEGRIVSKQVKTYLTPIELPGQLDLVPGTVSGGLGVVRTPVGTLGIATSKDAWMPDVTAKLDQRGADLLVQPEFFVGNPVSLTPPWQPDNIAGSGLSDVQRHPSLEALVLPELTGNVYDFTADNQGAIAVKPRGRRPPRGFLAGQPSSPGYVAVQPYAVPDPVGRPLGERRRVLGAAGEAMLPRDSSPPCPDAARPGACRGGQQEGVIHHDVVVARRPSLRRREVRKRGRTPFTANRPLAPSRRPQRNVRLASAGRRVVAVFEERRGRRWRVLAARSGDGGRSWRRPVPVAAGRAGQQWWPAVARRGHEVWVAWQDARRVLLSRSTDGGRRFGPARPVDPAPARHVHQWRPSVTANGPGRALVAFIDERERSADDRLPQARPRIARASATAIAPSQRLDVPGPPPSALAAKLDHAWAPDIAARGRRVVAAWLDFGTYDWDVLARVSEDGGATFGPETTVNDTPPELEALEDTPRVAVTRGGPLVAFTDWGLGESTLDRAGRLYDVRVSGIDGPDRQVDTGGDRHVNAFAPDIVTAPGGALVTWQDHGGRGDGDVFIRRAAGGSARRVDDTGGRGWNAWRPALAVSGRRAVAAWEDERDGPPQVYVATAPMRRLR